MLKVTVYYIGDRGINENTYYFNSEEEYNEEIQYYLDDAIRIEKEYIE